MGLYSLNRVAGLTENAYINKSLIESMDDSNNFTETSLLEVSQIITEHENKMFNTLIELDFVSAMNEVADTSNADKGIYYNKKKENILQKAADLLKKVWEAIKNVFLTFVDKIRTLLNSDKKIIEKYVPALEKVTDFSKLTTKFEYPNVLLDKLPTFTGNELWDNLDKVKSGEYVTEFKKKFDIFNTDTLTKYIVKDAIDTIKNEKFVQKFKDIAKAITDNAKNRVDVQKKAGVDDDSKAYYDNAVAVAKAAKQCSAIYIGTAKRMLADYRKILIIAGKWALAGAGEEKKAEDKKADDKKEAAKTNEKKNDEDLEESAMFDFALMEASDLYVTECLEF